MARRACRALSPLRPPKTRCGQDAEDVLQEALVETWKRAGGRPDTALVFATINRRAIDLARRTGRRTIREKAAGPEVLFAGSPEDAELATQLEKEIQCLPEAQREVLTLKFWGGLTFAEVATALGIPPGTAASRYRLALQALRQTLSLTLT
jgi:RNA polymerase sigma-70 factor (ECF subfamily)